MEEQANYGNRVFKDKIITKKDLLKKIDKEMEKLNPSGVE